jgi:adenylate cyclase
MDAQDHAWLETANGERLPLRMTCTIGRGPENTVVLTAEKVSRRHALIHAQNETEFWLVDLGSRNGTFRNAARIRQPTRLEPGDSIEIGPLRFTFGVQQSHPSGESGSALAETVVTKRATEVWLFLVDVVGFTELCRTLQAEELSRRVGSWLLRCAEVLERAGGCIDKYVGDGFLAYWSVDKTSGSSLSSTLANIDALRNQDPIRFRWCLHQTHLHLGTSRFGNESLIGPEINFIFRMEKLASSLNADRLLSASATEALGSVVTPRSLGEHSLKGFDGQFEFFSY